MCSDKTKFAPGDLTNDDIIWLCYSNCNILSTASYVNSPIQWQATLFHTDVYTYVVCIICRKWIKSLNPLNSAVAFIKKVLN